MGNVFFSPKGAAVHSQGCKPLGVFAGRNPSPWVLVALLLLASPSLRAADGVAPDAEIRKTGQAAVGIEPRVGAQIDMGLTFRDEYNRPISLAQASNGKPTILVLAYYRCPMLCNKTLNDLTNAMRGMDWSIGNEFNVVVVSFDPKEKYDRAAEKKANYVKDYGREGADKHWRFLTGDKENIKTLAETVGFRYEYDKTIKEYNHASGLMILTPAGVVSNYFFGIGYEPKSLRLSLVEASDGTLGTVGDQVMLICYRFDGATGKYSMSIKAVVRVLGAVTVFAILGGLLIAFRRDRKKNRAVATA